MDEKLHQELMATLIELKRFLATQKSRPTEMIPRAENLTRRLLSEQQEKCIQAWEKAIGDRFGQLCRDIKNVDSRLKELNDKIFKEVRGVGEASKTTLQDVRTLDGRLSMLEDRLQPPGQQHSYETRMKEVEDWIQEEEERRLEVSERSNVGFTKAMTVISIIMALIFGLSGLIISIIQLRS